VALSKLAFALQAYRMLARNRTYVLTWASLAAYTFALGGIATWLPSFLERIHGISRTRASSLPDAILVVTGFIGTFAGGWLGDTWLPRNRQVYLWLSSIATLTATPIALLVFVAPSPVVFWSATIQAVTVNVVSPTMRATAMASQILFIHLLGDVPSPPLIGAISDASSLATGLLVVPVAVFVSGVFWVYAAWQAARTAPAVVSLPRTAPAVVSLR